MLLILKRSLLLLAVSLVIGLAINQVHPQGIGWTLLRPLPPAASDAQLGDVSVEDAFFFFLESKARFIDVRSREAYAIDHIPGALSLPLNDYYRNPAQIGTFDREAALVIYCFDSQCSEAGILAQELHDLGFQEVRVCTGGFSEWLEKGFPVAQGAEGKEENTY